MSKNTDACGAFKYWSVTAAAWIVFAAVCIVYFRDPLRAMSLQAYEVREAAWLLAILATGGIILWLVRAGRLTATAAKVTVSRIVDRALMSGGEPYLIML